SLANLYVVEDVAALERLQCIERVLMVPFGTRNTLSKLNVVLVLPPEPLTVLTTRELVLRAVVPSYIWQPLRLLALPVKYTGRLARRMSSPDCEASRSAL